MTYYNYVFFMPKVAIIKIGITANPDRRLQEIGRTATKFGEQKIRYMTSRTLPGVARITETELRRNWRHWAIAGHLEWIVGGPLDFSRICEETVEVQNKFEIALGVA